MTSQANVLYDWTQVEHASAASPTRGRWSSGVYRAHDSTFAGCPRSFSVQFNIASDMRFTLAIQLLALPACLREAFVAAASHEPSSTSDSLDQVIFTDACPDFAQYSRVRQYGHRSILNVGDPDAKPTIAHPTAKAR